MRSILIALALVAAAATYAWLDADDGVGTWMRLRDEVRQARSRVTGLEQGNVALAEEVRALRSDPYAQERAVREDLRWVRPGEVLVRVMRDGASSELPDPARALP